MSLIKKSLVAIFCFSFLSMTLNAKECISINELKIKWTSYKTLEKVSVNGSFDKIELITTKNKSTLQEALLNTKAKINLKNINAYSNQKTDNILKYFVKNLKSSKVEAKILKVNKKTMDIEFTLNEKSKVIPMKYKIAENKVIIKGVIDAQDFDLVPALEILNKEVSGHQNKGWFDIPIKLDLFYTKTCN
ncbi:YceI family protein [Malaciobacter mytili]|uniref:YceI-like domain-containing periplasmic protein n=1 Tax=Malaciobacter mytili LMG 24559 TaxID=1032238 RepID=A0AAX2AHF1_9BACT|nr:YceI family protein [Malaciobacter mytili]AXH14904.1 hypothetical protein AMYT_1322 [Malaciobacter mytili LMG 24559]RXK14881.1 hypothetical protein CP985_11605 [Malaciobacter mytili LMG 24559]